LRVEDDDSVAALGESDGDRAADSGAGTGDE
jgi:hypothetical protein